MSSNDTGSGRSFNHVQFYMDNGILVIKINLGQMLSFVDSDNSKDTSSSRKESSSERSKVEPSTANQPSANNSPNVHRDPSPLEDGNESSKDPNIDLV